MISLVRSSGVVGLGAGLGVSVFCWVGVGVRVGVRVSLVSVTEGSLGEFFGRFGVWGVGRRR